MNFAPPIAAQRRKAVPRGIAAGGPALLSYGFRPFFLLAGLYALLAMALWIFALTRGLEIGGSYGTLNWHAHEILFGYASAALAGFMLTAIPNWTGRLPVSGLPLLALAGLWVLGRLAMVAPGTVGEPWSMIIDAAFLPAMALIAGREIIAGKNWKNLKILAGLAMLSVANIGFHLSVAVGAETALASRATVSVYILLIALVGGRIVPSFTRNWLARAGAHKLPTPFDRVDVVSITALLAALISWTILPEGWLTAIAAGLATCVQAYRLSRWQGWRTVEEPLLVVLHIAYAFLPIGMAGISGAAMGWLSAPSALHLLTVGGIGNMTLAVMTRVTLGHTGRRLAASPVTTVAYLAMLVAAVVRPFAELLPNHYHLILTVSGGCWMLAFAAFLFVYGPMLWTRNLAARSRA